MSWNTAILNRNFGLDVNREDAYVTGYFFGLFSDSAETPNTFKNIRKSLDEMYGCDYVKGPDDIKYVLAAFLTGAPTLPSGTLNFDTIQAMGGTKWGVASNVDYGDTFTLHFVEMSGIPIIKIISAWFNMIRDRNSGRSRLKNYAKTEFSLDFVYATTRPNGTEIEFAALFTGCYPLKDPLDLLSGDVATVGQLGLDIDFHFDRVWVDDHARCRAESELKLIEKYDKYYQGKSGADPKAVFKIDM